MAAEGLPVQMTCRVLNVSESGYYAWRKRAPSTRVIRHAWLTDLIGEVHLASRGTYGARRVQAELVLGRGVTVGHQAVELLMRRAGIQGLSGRSRSRRAPHSTTAGDLVNRDFAHSEPDQLWVTDITEHPTRERQGLLCRRPRRFLAQGGRLVHRRSACNQPGHQRPRDGHPGPSPGRFDRDPQRSGSPIHLVGVHPASS
jgi:hypothetical protein